MDRFMVALAGALYTIALLFIAVSIIAFVPAVHTPFLGSPAQQPVDRAITDYLLTGDEDGLTLLTETEASHMRDVAWWTNTMLCLLAGLIAVLTFLFVHAKREERVVITFAPFITILLLQLPAILMVERFQQSFARFHELFFPQGNYLFAPTSTLISTYPGTFFATMTVLIGVAFVILSLVGIVAAHLAHRHAKQYSYEQMSEKEKEIEDLALRLTIGKR